MNTIEDCFFIIRQKVITNALQKKTTKEELEKDHKIEDIALFILQTFGQCYPSQIDKFSCIALKDRFKFNQTAMSGVYEQLRLQQFDKFVQSLASRKSAFATTTVTELGNQQIKWVFYLPWKVQQLSAVQNLGKQWKGVDIITLIAERQKEEEELDKKFLKAIQTKTVDPSDVFPLEIYMLSPAGIKGETATSLFSLLRSWLMIYPQPDLEDFIFKSFPLLTLLKDEPISYIPYRVYDEAASASSPAIVSTKVSILSSPIPIPKASQSDMKLNHANGKEKESASMPPLMLKPLVPAIPVNFSDFRLSFLLDCLAHNLGVESFCDSTQFSRSFYFLMLKTLRESVSNGKDAVFFAGRTKEIPERAILAPFLEACKRFIKFRDAAATKENISFLLEWIALSEGKEEASFSTEAVNLKEIQTFDFLRRKIDDFKIAEKYRFTTMVGLLNLKSYPAFIGFLKGIQEKRFFHIDDIFIREFLSKKINRDDYLDLLMGCEFVFKLLSPHFSTLFLPMPTSTLYNGKSPFWASICEYINKFESRELAKILGYFPTEVFGPQSEAKEKASNEVVIHKKNEEMDQYENCFLEVCLMYLQHPLFRLYVNKVNLFISEIETRFTCKFTLKDRFQIFNGMRFHPALYIQQIKDEAITKGEKAPLIKKALEQQHEIIAFILARKDLARLPIATIIDAYLEPMQKLFK